MSKNSIKAIENAKVVLENGIIWDGVIVITDEKITAYGKRGEVEIPDGAELIDAAGAYVGPGFVDIHVHAAPDLQTSTNPKEAAEFFLRHGETTILATPAGTGRKSLDEILDAIKTIREAMKTSKSIKGIYMEGPYYNGRYGASSKVNTWGTKPVLPEDYEAMVNAGGEDIKVWMIAPEREGLVPFLAYARSVNPDVVFAVGHSEALPSEIRALGRYKPTILTHAMDATGRRPVPGGTRAFGPDEYCFREPDMYAELISDSLGIHVNCEMQQLLLHTKGVHRVVLITDSTSYSNPNPEKFAHVKDLNFDPWGGISGSKLTMDVACRNVMAHTNSGIAQAFLMASTNPAKAIGMYDDLGSIDIDKKADLVFVDDMFNVKKVMLEGEICEF